jgi:hypothetical protein
MLPSARPALVPTLLLALASAAASPGCIPTDPCEGGAGVDCNRTPGDGDDCDDADDPETPLGYEIAGNGIDDDCDGTADGGALGLVAIAGLENDLVDALEAECALHGRQAVYVDFEDGTAGASTTEAGPDFGILADDPPVDYYRYTLGDADALPARSGSLYAGTVNPVDAAQLLFAEPQSMVLVGIGGASTDAGEGYPLEARWDGVSVATAPDLFSGEAAALAWDFRGAQSTGNLGFDTLLVNPAGGVGPVNLDDVWYCD